jgi:hypothetical protein
VENNFFQSRISEYIRPVNSARNVKSVAANPSLSVRTRFNSHSYSNLSFLNHHEIDTCGINFQEIN